MSEPRQPVYVRTTTGSHDPSSACLVSERATPRWSE